MMKKVTFNSLTLSFVVLCVSAVAGLMITWKLAGWVSAIEFLYCSAIASVIILVFQIIIYSRARRELFFQRLYIGSLGVILTWLFLSVSLPILWISFVGRELKLGIVCIFFITSAVNIIFSYNLLERKWKLSGEAEFELRYNQSENSIEWDKVLNAMKIEHEIVVPGVPKNFSPILNFCIFCLMIVGLNLRSIFPVFSIFAWGIPTLIMASLFVQISSFNFFQAYKIHAIQARKNVIIWQKD